MRKNILILAHNYGMQFLESCNQYTQLFDREQYAVTVVYLTGEDDADVRRKTQAEDVLFMNCGKAQIRGLKLGVIYKLYQLCRQKKFDTVICHRYKPTYIMLWVAQFVRIKKLYFVLHALGTMHSIPRKMMLSTLFRKNMILAGVSDAVRDDMRHDLPLVSSQQIITLYNIIDHQLFEPQLLSREKARAQLNIPDDAFVFGNIGRLVKAKDQKTLIAALSFIKTLCPQAKIVIIGDGRLETELKQQAFDLQLEDDVIFAGFILDGFRLFKAFDAVVLCSIEEAFGRVLLEAMIARVPIIAAQVDGIPEVVGHTGYLVPAGNPKALAEQMQKIYELPMTELSTLGEKSYQRMLENFSLEPFKKTYWRSGEIS